MLFTQYYSSSLSIFLKLHSHKHFVVRGFALTIPNVATTVKNRHTKIRRRVENLRHYRFLLLDIFSRNKPYKERKKEIKTENDSDQSIRKTGEKLRLTKWQVVPFVMSNGQRPNRNDTWPVTGWFLKYWKTKSIWAYWTNIQCTPLDVLEMKQSVYKHAQVYMRIVCLIIKPQQTLTMLKFSYLTQIKKIIKGIDIWKSVIYK